MGKTKDEKMKAAELKEDELYQQFAERTCKSCNKTFIPAVPNQWYCSRTCREKNKKRYTPSTDMNAPKVETWTERVAAINELARAKHMSYGMYVATEGAGKLITKVSFPS